MNNIPIKKYTEMAAENMYTVSRTRKKGNGMAKPIKETPILYGKDSDRFLKEIKENEKKKVPSEDYKRALDIYSKVIKKAKL